MHKMLKLSDVIWEFDDPIQDSEVHACSLMGQGGRVEPFFVQMVQIIIACIHERFAIVAVHVSYILLVSTHFCLGTRKVYHQVEIIWLQRTQDVKDDKMKCDKKLVENVTQNKVLEHMKDNKMKYLREKAYGKCDMNKFLEYKQFKRVKKG